MRPLTYIKFLFLGFVCAMALAMAFSYVIDPYRIFLTPTTTGIDSIKTKASGEIFFNRAVGIKNTRPKTILLGNSRVQWGLSAGSDMWPEDMKPVYNAAIPGSNNQTALAYLKYAIDTGDVKTVVLGLDFFSSLVKANADPQKPIILGDYEPLLTAENNPAKRIKNYFFRLASLNSVIDSFLTIVEQKNPFAKNILKNGDNPLNEYRGYVANKGQYRLFKNYLSGTKLSLAQDKRAFLAENDSSPEFDALKRILVLAEKNGVLLYMYFHPYHVTLKNLIKSSGRAGEYEKWRERVISLARQHKNIRLWDFGARNAWTSEPVPVAGDKITHMKWYWEPGHYKKALGDIILARMLGVNSLNSWGSFGERIIPPP